MTSLLSKANFAVRNALREPVRAFARSMGFDVVRRKPQLDTAQVAFDMLLQLRLTLNDVRDERDRQFLLDCAKHIGDSKSQILQDLSHCTSLPSNQPASLWSLVRRMGSR